MYYLKKKLHVLEVKLAAAAVAPTSMAVATAIAAADATAAADPATAAAPSAAATAAATALAGTAAADPWSVDTNGNMGMPAAQKMMKH